MLGRPARGLTPQEPTCLTHLGSLTCQAEAESPPEILPLPGLFQHLIPSITGLSRGHFHWFVFVCLFVS